MASQTPPGPNNSGPPIRRESTIKSLAKKARTLTIGSNHSKEAPPEEELTQESYAIYHLRWEEKLRPFLKRKFPDLSEKYGDSDVCLIFSMFRGCCLAFY
jgi:hypothetical protein